MPLAVTKTVLVRHCGHQIDKHSTDGRYPGADDWDQSGMDLYLTAPAVVWAHPA